MPVGETCESALPNLELRAIQLGIELTPAQLQRFVLYCRMLRNANQSMNLTALRLPGQIMNGLFLSSLTLAGACPPDFLNPSSPISVVDVGSGAGVPGIPLKIAFPHWRLTAIDSTRKKADFISTVARALGLSDITVLAERAETLGRDNRYRDRAHLCLARAVARTSTLLELCAPLTAPGGLLAFAKGSDVASEVRTASTAARALNCELADIVTATSPDAPLGTGTIVLYRKIGPTPIVYPRRVGLANSRPIGP